MLSTVDETSLDELREGHAAVYPEIADELSTLDVGTFFAPQGEAWSPAQHADHLIRSVRPMTGALRMPRWKLRLAFGPRLPFGRRRSRSTENVVGGYLEKLAGGGRAMGRYVPEAQDDEPTRERQTELLDRLRRLGPEVEDALGGWREKNLDRYRLPHPLMGLLTVREMLAWSLYHARHHRERIRERS